MPENFPKTENQHENIDGRIRSLMQEYVKALAEAGRSLEARKKNAELYYKLCEDLNVVNEQIKNLLLQENGIFEKQKGIDLLYEQIEDGTGEGKVSSQATKEEMDLIKKLMVINGSFFKFRERRDKILKDINGACHDFEGTDALFKSKVKEIETIIQEISSVQS
jgi:hypothetical protein